MKTLLHMTLATTLLAGSAFAQEMAETTREINAQTTITRTAVENVISRMGSGNAPTQFNANDYKNEAATFRNELDFSMKRFEDRLNKEVLSQAAFWMNQYNSVYASNEFSPAQKELLLKQRLENIVHQFAALSVKYQGIIREAYSLVPNYDLNLSAEMSSLYFRYDKNNKQTVSVRLKAGTWSERKSVAMNYGTNYCENTNSTKMYIPLLIEGKADSICLPYKLDPKNRKHYYVTMTGADVQPLFVDNENILKQVFQKAAYKKMKGECRTSICMGLKASDLTGLLTLLKTNIDKNISLRLADGNAVTLEGLKLDTAFALKIMARVDYPEQLPFDL